MPRCSSVHRLFTTGFGFCAHSIEFRYIHAKSPREALLCSAREQMQTIFTTRGRQVHLAENSGQEWVKDTLTAARVVVQ